MSGWIILCLVLYQRQKSFYKRDRWTTTEVMAWGYLEVNDKWLLRVKWGVFRFTQRLVCSVKTPQTQENKKTKPDQNTEQVKFFRFPVNLGLLSVKFRTLFFVYLWLKFDRNWLSLGELQCVGSYSRPVLTPDGFNKQKGYPHLPNRKKTRQCISDLIETPYIS